MKTFPYTPLRTGEAFALHRSHTSSAGTPGLSEAASLSTAANASPLRTAWFVLAPLLLVFVLGCREDPHASPPARPATSTSSDTSKPYPPAPDFEGTTLSGDTFRLASQDDKVVVLNFWATWCGPCRIEIPDFIQLQEELKGEVQFVGVSLDEGGAEIVRPYAEKMNINYPIIVNGGAIARRYGGIPFVPATFIISSEGRVRHLFAGLTTRSRLRPVLLEMIGEAP